MVIVYSLKNGSKNSPKHNQNAGKMNTQINQANRTKYHHILYFIILDSFQALGITGTSGSFVFHKK